MSSTYSNLGIELIGTGEQAGTWGTTTNNNFSTIIDNAIVGYKAVAVTGTSSVSPTVLTVSDGSASDGQKRIIEATGSPASAGFLRIDPNDFAGYYFIRNSTTQTLNVFQGTYSAVDAVTIETGYDAIIRCNGGGAGAVVSFINYNLKTGNISANGTVTATALSGPHNGTVGATTPSTGAFTTLSASSTVSGTGFSTYLASPPAIGGTAAAAGSFTTLAASSTVSGTGFSTYLASPPAIGGTAAAAGAFTTLSASSTVSGTGFSTYLASPPAIGGTAAAAGAFTTLSASSTVSGTGFSTYLASPPAIGGTTPAAGTFTTVSGRLTPSAGTATAGTAPLKFTTGTNLTTAEAGAVEYNGATFFATANTAPGRGYLPHYAFYIATTNGGVSSGTTVDAFPANSSISLAANTNYEIEAVLFPNKSAGAVGTIQFSQVTSAAVSYMAGYVSLSPSGVATSAVATYSYGGYVGAGTTGTFPGFNATTLTTYDFTFKIRVYVGANPVNWRLRFVNSVGTVTILSTSYYLVRALPAASVGTFVA